LGKHAPHAHRWAWRAARLHHWFGCQTIREEKFHSALKTVMKSVAQLFSFAFLKALCFGGG